MRVIRLDTFEDAHRKLPSKTKLLCERQIALLQTNLCDARLHLKKLRGYDNVYAFRITRIYRALFYFDADDNIVLFEFDHRKDVYRKLK